jgi:hypothetical protein
VRNFLGRLASAPGKLAMVVVVAMSTTAALTAAVVVAGLLDRVAKLESDLGKAQTRLVELAAAQSKLGASVDTADRAIKSLRADLDHPRVRPLASILEPAPLQRQ